MKLFSGLEESFLKFIVRRASKLSEVINQEVEKEVINYHRKIVEMNKADGVVWPDGQMAISIESAREFRRENIKSSAPHVIAVISMMISIISAIVAVIALVK